MKEPTNKEDIDLYVLKNLHKVVKCGIHSGFPTCCIKFFVTQKLWMPWKENYKYMEKIRSVEAAVNNKLVKNGVSDYNKLLSINYIPCPKCLKEKTFVNVKRCPKNSNCSLKRS